MIPESLTELIGRDHELKDLSQLVSEHRLVTLVGPGGVGKTRLALEVARAEAAPSPSAAASSSWLHWATPRGCGRPSPPPSTSPTPPSSRR